ncbi:unnamed protein product [Caenorhabditis nigoni]
MSDKKEKKISVSQVFNNLSNLKKGATNGETVKRFGCFWKIRLFKKYNGDIRPDLICENSEPGNWSINTTCSLVVNGKPFYTGLQFGFRFTNNSMKTDLKYIRKEDFPEFRIGESAEIEFRVKINWMTGIKEKQKSMIFDDDVAKEASDIVLTVGDQKFYVFKNYLSLHSTYFKSLFSGNFSESQESEIELKEIDSEDFQDFLEIIYGVSVVDDETVSEILNLADFFDAKNAVRRCEDFLMNYSRKSLKEKFGMAVDYKMENLKKKCLSENQNSDDFPEIFPEVSDDHENCIYKELLEKSMSFK